MAKAKQAKKLAKPADLVKPAEAKPVNGKPSLAAFIAKLADQHGINPADVPGHQPCQEALRKAKVAKVSPATLHEARILHRQGIQQTMAKVAQHNAKVMDRMTMDEEITPASPATNPEEKQTQAAVSKAAKEMVRIIPASPIPQKKGATKAIPAPTLASGKEKQPITGGKVRTAVFGYAATAVIRAMGVKGFTFDEAREGMDRVGGKGIADATIKIQLAAGKKGERGDPAKLTSAQLASLKG